MTSRESITSQTLVSEADALLTTGPVLVAQTDSLETIATKAVEKPNCRVISVVDDEGHLVGLVPVRMLVNDIFLKIVPEEFLGEISDLGAALEYAQHIAARTAADIMIPAVSLRATETVRTAFERMHHSHLNGLPIVDDANRVVGYLDQFELLMVWIQSTGRGALLRPSSDSPA
ncbi:MAG TPA: CBS domain-containing protein [Candidatus Limnocylindria bacterium]|nr:CBS domain-containing protein [Candidatus Limnocylindria bacterium]